MNTLEKWMCIVDKAINIQTRIMSAHSYEPIVGITVIEPPINILKHQHHKKYNVKVCVHIITILYVCYSVNVAHVHACGQLQYPMISCCISTSIKLSTSGGLFSCHFWEQIVNFY